MTWTLLLHHITFSKYLYLERSYIVFGFLTSILKSIIKELKIKNSMNNNTTSITFKAGEIKTET